MIDWQRLTDIPYLLNPTPTYLWRFIGPLGIVTVVCLISGIILSFIKPLDRYPWRNPIAQWLRWLGSISLLLIFFRWQAISYASARILWYFLALGFLGWLAAILWPLWTRQKQQPNEPAKRYETFDKYLPRPKKTRAH